jgi:endonuclease YncB( thermonuclease family)
MWRPRPSGRVHSFRPRRNQRTRSADDALLLYGSPWRGRSRLSRFGPSLLLFGAIALAVWSPSGPPASTISGAVHIIDGDTLEMQGERVRILDIDAPETRQTCRRSDGVVVPCGQLATAALAGLIGSRSVTCGLFERDRYGRWLGRCSVGGDDVANWLALHGLAIPYRSCACVAVRGLSLYARWNERGIWATDFQAPWEWRAAN